MYDSTQKVKTLAITYVGEVGAPTCKEVFGMEVTAAADAGLNKIVRYPKAGYWIAYNRTAGTDPIITVTMQKIEE